MRMRRPPPGRTALALAFSSYLLGLVPSFPQKWCARNPDDSFFDPRIGRPSVPMETYLRMMFLKSRYRLGYQTLCREVGDSISWQRFCPIPFGTRVRIRRR